MSIQIVLQPDATAGVDTHIRNAGYANANFGDGETLAIGTAQFLKVSTFMRGLLRFDLSALPPQATIVAATLTLFHDPGGLIADDGLFSARRITRHDWTELGATWNQYDGASAWTTPGGDYSTADSDWLTIASALDDLVFDGLANLAIDAVENRGGLLELLIVGPETSNTNYVLVHSSDAVNEAKRPRLVVTCEVPEVLMPQLIVTDHGDNTGATATIAGAAPDSTNTVYVQTFAAELGAGTWTSAGQIEGNGDLELDLPPGHYFATVVSSLSGSQAVSNVTYFVVTDGVDSIHTRCLAAAQARIRLLALDGLAGENVVIEKLPAGRNLAAGVGLPAVVLSPHRAAMPAGAGTNGRDDVYYDVLVAIFDRDNQEPTLLANLDRHFLWRQQIARAFRNQRLAGVPEVINAEVEPAEGLLEEAWKRELMTSAVLLRFTSRETRGFN